MTEEQQGGTEPPAGDLPSTEPAPEQRVAAVAVADEPAIETVEAPDGAPSSDGSEPEPASTATEVGESDEADAPASAEVTTADTPAEPVEAVAEVEAAPLAAEPVEAVAEVEAAPLAAEPVEAVAEVEDAPLATEPVEAVAEVEAAPVAEAVAAPVAEAPAPVAPRPVPQGPEPTTMEELLAEQDADIRSFKHGDVVEGSVVRIDKDEILVDIGAKSEGVVSNRELFGRNTETQPQLAIGDVVLVYVLQPESPEGHAVLSLRRAGLERKWRSMQEQFEAGVIIEAPVIDHNKGGLIVDCGIRGFVPISQIVDFPRRPQNDQPRDAAQEIAEKLQPYVGRKLRLKILEVNRKANRLILSEKVALYEERREKRDELFSSLQVGQKVTGNVRSIAPFGVFIDLGGIDGLVHKSELSWNKVNNPEAGYKVGDEVEAEVIDINHERGRISLSIRRLQPDPWHSTVADFKVGDVIDGTVTKLVNFGAFVRVRDGLEGLIHISELSHQRVAHPGDVVHEGQELKLKIISLDSERHRLGLSLKQAEEAPARPMPEPGPSGQPRPERRPRGGERERGYSMADAVQEPEGGIDNTLAAAFAQVRQQLAAAEAAEPEQAAEVAEAVEPEPAAEVAEEPAAEMAEAAPAIEQAPEPERPAAELAEEAPAVEPASPGEAVASTEPVELAPVEAEPGRPDEGPAVEGETGSDLAEGAAEAGPSSEIKDDHSSDEVPTEAGDEPADDGKTEGGPES